MTRLGHYLIGQNVAFPLGFARQTQRKTLIKRKKRRNNHTDETKDSATLTQVICRSQPNHAASATRRGSKSHQLNQCEASRCGPPSGRTSDAIKPLGPLPKRTKTVWPGRNSVMP
jgi:hypothetical protein